MIEDSEPFVLTGVVVIYRSASGKGIAITTIDTLIAAIALEHRASVFTLDRDFSRIALMTGLALYRS